MATTERERIAQEIQRMPKGQLKRGINALKRYFALACACTAIEDEAEEIVEKK